jgi:hypothetical protein
MSRLGQSVNVMTEVNRDWKLRARHRSKTLWKKMRNCFSMISDVAFLEFADSDADHSEVGWGGPNPAKVRQDYQ